MKSHYLQNNFGCLPDEYSSKEKSAIVIIPAPYGGTLSYKTGANEGPNAIIRASMNMELYDEELKKNTFEKGIHTLPEIEPDFSSPESMIKRVEEAASDVAGAGKLPVLLGGEHSISAGAVRALKQKFPALSVLQIDAHTDLRESWEGTRHSHACVMKRITELCRAVQIGIRSTSEEEKEAVEKNRKNIFWAKDMKDSSWMDKAISRLSDDVYLTIDLDGLDPSIMPAVGTPEPGGIQWYPLLRFLKKLCEKKTIRGFDVVELSPIPGNISPDFLAAKLVYKIIGYMKE